MKIDRLNQLREEPNLSSAYLESLVKQLTSARTKDPMNPKDLGCKVDDGFSSQNITKFGKGLSENQQSRQTQQSQPHKKQVRRRLHTSRPYKESLLNMAEARREIVTALKFHRAAMKQAKEQQQQQQQQEGQQFQQLHQEQQHSQQPSLPTSPPCFEQEGKIKSRRNPRTYQSSTANFSNYQENFDCGSSSHPPPPYAFLWPAPILPPSISENINVPLPDQTLGLNLNFHDFNNIDTNFHLNSDYPSSLYFASSPSSSASPPLSMATEELPLVSQAVPPAVSDGTETYGGNGLHRVMDAEEMAEMRSIGEQHQMEWNDTMNLVTSAWWFKFWKTIDLGPEVKDEDVRYHTFDHVMEFPAWLNANDGCSQQQMNDDCSQDYFYDTALPWFL